MSRFAINENTRELKKNLPKSNLEKANISKNKPLNANDFLLQRKAGCACGGGCPACQEKNTNLPVSQPNDASEIEADQIADKVMRTPESASFSAPKPRSETGAAMIQTKSEGGFAASDKLSDKFISSGGGNLNADTRLFMEKRFGMDFGGVKIHTGGEAVQMSRTLDARAFTVGSDIYFNEGEFAPHTESGKRLLAHELAHVSQQGDGGIIRRCANPKVNDPKYDAFAVKLKDHAVYKALDPAPKAVADTILVEAKKKNDCLYLLGKLQSLFNTPEAAAAAIAKSTRAAVATEHKKEQERLAKQDPKVRDREETASAAVAGKLLPVKGKFGGGSYLMDKTDLGNVVVKIKIHLIKASGATDDDVKKIKEMQDGIEKAAAVKGFTLDVEFPDAKDAETFEVKVNPEAWTVADEWGSGSSLTSIAHEIFHLMAFELDRYNYIESHSTNEHMKIPDRLTWFAAQLTKPAGFDDPTSLMASGSHPTDEDICMVIGGGSVPTDCVKDRKKAVKP